MRCPAEVVEVSPFTPEKAASLVLLGVTEREMTGEAYGADLEMVMS